MQQIKTFEEACKKLGVSPKDLPIVKALPAKHQQALIAHYKLVIIAEALNDGWQPDWNNFSQGKYYPWFDVIATAKKPSGSGLSCDGCDRWLAYTTVGSRLCYKDSETAKYAGKQFKKLYEEYFLIS